MPVSAESDRETMVEMRSVVKRYGSTTILNGISHKFARAGVSVVCGPSGCGKSTLLRCIHTLESFQDGDILIHGISVRDPKLNLPKLRQRIGMVFQQPNLYPHLTCL